jgi:membrane protease YdiL (CAAX protease family)
MLEFHEDLVKPQRHPAVSLVLILLYVIIGFVALGPLIGVLVAYPFFSGSMVEYANAIQDIPSHPELKIPLYIIQGFATVIGLIVAPAIYLKNESKSIGSFFKQPLELTPIVITVIVVIAFVVADSVVIQWNASVHFPDFLKGFEAWAKEKEESAATLTEMMTHFDSLGEVVLAMVGIAILPAIGEELVFRGLIQNEFYRGTKNIHVSIWISAILFSAIHIQFYGFIPRMLLGALFGYLYFWSGNLSIAILAHFVNNAFSVLGIYLSQRGNVDKEIIEGSEAAPWPAVLSSAVLTILLLYFFKRYYQQKTMTTEVNQF